MSNVKDVKRYYAHALVSCVFLGTSRVALKLEGGIEPAFLHPCIAHLDHISFLCAYFLIWAGSW